MTELLKDEKSIIAWLNEHGIKNYKLVTDAYYDYVVDVYGSIDLCCTNIKNLAIKFNIVSGNFDCSHNQLTNLKGCPTYVGSIFDCSNNVLLTLQHGPTTVGLDFDCRHNQIIDLEYASSMVVGRNFNCNHNHLKSLQYCPDVVGCLFDCSDNPLLGSYQEITDFTEIKKISEIYKEKILLSQIKTGTTSKTYKL